MVTQKGYFLQIVQNNSMKELLKKMASIANELDLNGFEKEANQVTASMAKMARMAQTVEERGEQYKISDSSLRELDTFVKEHTLSLEDAYAYIKGKYGERQANDYAAWARGQTPSAASAKGQTPSAAYQTGAVTDENNSDTPMNKDDENAPINENDENLENLPWVGAKQGGITTRFKNVFAQQVAPAPGPQKTPAATLFGPQTPPASNPLSNVFAPATTPKASKKQVYAFMKNAIATYANLKPSYDDFMNEKDKSNRLEASTRGKKFVDDLQHWIDTQLGTKRQLLQGYSENTNRIITDKLFAIPIEQVKKMQSQAKIWLNEAPSINWQVFITGGQMVRDMETNLREIENGCRDALDKMAQV